MTDEIQMSVKLELLKLAQEQEERYRLLRGEAGNTEAVIARAQKMFEWVTQG